MQGAKVGVLVPTYKSSLRTRPACMSSTMCFNRRFARELLADIGRDTGHQYTDNIVAKVTMPKFRCHRSDRHTCIYHSHEGSVTSHDWLAKAFV